MSDLRKAAEMALNYFESAYELDSHETEIREALRQALSNEFNPDWNQIEALQESLREHMAEIQALRQALAQPKREWVGVTYDEVYEFVCTTDSYINLARAIEAKLKEKNT